MSDAIELMASGSHGNVATVYSSPHCVTPSLADWSGGGVPQESQRKGDSIDVSEYSTLRLSLDVTSMTHSRGDEQGEPNAAHLYVSIEHLIDGAWKVLHTFDRMASRGRQSCVLSGFGRTVRASWYFVRPGFPNLTVSEGVAFSWSLTGEALPESA